MRRVTGKMELAALNADPSSAYLDDVVAECNAIVKSLDDCLASVREMRRNIMAAGGGGE